MSPLERYTPEICAQLRQFAEKRQWHPWDSAVAHAAGPQNAHLRNELLEDVELTYHLHLAAEASGIRAGMPPMPAFPLKFNASRNPADPAEFIQNYLRRHAPYSWNQSDNRTASLCTRA